jgi:alcohol dehydrogenase class IV
MLPHVMRYLEPRTSAAQARIADALGVNCAADGVADLISRLGLPHHLAEYGLTEADIEAAARPVVSNEYPLEDLIEIYRRAM